MTHTAAGSFDKGNRLWALLLLKEHLNFFARSKREEGI